MASVLFARTAQTDLLEAWTFISEDSFEAADHVLDVIEREAQTLALQPMMGRARPELGVGIRCWPTSSSNNLYSGHDADQQMRLTLDSINVIF
jgi:plasmid stabilization system protein ParE